MLYRGNPSNMIFALALREYMDRSKFKRKDLGHLCGVTGSAVSKWVAGRSLPSLDSLLVICEYVRLTNDERKELVKVFMSIKKAIVLKVDNLKTEDQEKLLKRYKFKWNSLTAAKDYLLFLKRGVDIVKVKLGKVDVVMVDFTNMSLKHQMILLRNYIRLSNLPYTRL